MQAAQPDPAVRITLIGKPGCHLCDDAREVIARVAAGPAGGLAGAVHRRRPDAAARPTGSRSRSRWSTASSTTSGGSTRPGCAPRSRERPRRGPGDIAHLSDVARAARLCACVHKDLRWGDPCAPVPPCDGRGSYSREEPVSYRVTADPAARRGIPDATVARLPVYLRALTGLAERGITTVSSEELAAAAGVNSAKLRKDLSHLGSYGTRGVGLRRRVPRLPDLPRARPHPGLAGRHRRGRQPRSRAGQLRRLRLARLPRRGAARRRPRASSASRSPGLTVRPMADLEQLVAERRRRDRRHRHPGRVGPGGLRPARRRRRALRPELRAVRARRARRRRRAQGRPVDRAADPRLPRAAQGPRRAHGRRPPAAAVAALQEVAQ